MPTIGDHIARERRASGMTQDALAEQAGVSVETIRKLEQNDRTTARMATLNCLAKALKITTSELLGDASRARVRHEQDDDQLALVDIRRVLTPVRGIRPAGSSEPPSLAQVRATIRAVDQAYHADDYERALVQLPAMLTGAGLAAASDQRVALQIKAQAHELAGTVLTQVRAFDLAHRTLSLAQEAAAAANDELLDASSAVTMCWLLIREGRFDEAEQLALAVAEQIEPRFSAADPERLAIWGVLMLRAAAASVRDTRWETADDLLTAAAASAARIGDRIPPGVLDRHPASVATFGHSLVAMKRTEALVIAGRPGEALQVAASMPHESRPMLNNGNRHLLGVAHAQAMEGDLSDAAQTLFGLRDSSSMWLRQQKLARDVVGMIASARKRAFSRDLAELAGLVGADI